MTSYLTDINPVYRLRVMGTPRLAKWLEHMPRNRNVLGSVLAEDLCCMLKPLSLYLPMFPVFLNATHYQ